MKPLEAASKVLLEEVILEIANRGSSRVFNSIVGYRVEELINPRVEDRSSEYYTCVSSS